MNDVGPEIVKFIEREFGIHVLSIEYYDRSETILYKIISSIGSLSLKIYDPIPDVDFSVLGDERGRLRNLKNIGKILDFVSGYPNALRFVLPKPIKTITGEFSSLMPNGRPFVLASWIDGTDLLHPTRSNELLEGVGKCLAWFHNVATLFATERHLQIPRRLPVMLNAMKSRIEHSTISQELQQRLTNACELVDKCEKSLAESCSVVVHGDASLSNIIEHDGWLSLIDFSLCGYATPYFDLGALAFELQSENAFEYLIEGYQELFGNMIDVHMVKVYRMFRALLYACANLHQGIDMGWISSDPMEWVGNLWAQRSTQYIQ